MGKFTVLEKSFINNGIREVGEVIDYDGPASANLEPVPGDKEAVGQAAEGPDMTEGIARMAAAANTGNPDNAGLLAALAATKAAAAPAAPAGDSLA